MRFSLLPREEKFFELFARLAVKLVDSAQALRDMLTHYSDVERKGKAIRELEHEADVLTHEIMDRLNKTFITPLEREDIRALAQYLDDVIDDIEHTANRFLIYRIERPTLAAVEMVEIVCKAAEQILRAVENLENLKEVHVFIREINRLENMADDIAREQIGRLFREEEDLRVVLKWKDVYEQLEACADRCEDVADTIEDIVVKNA